MVDLVFDNPDRTSQNVIDDLERVLAGIGDDAPALELALSALDFALLMGFAGKPGVSLIRDYPGVTKALKMQVVVQPGYRGPPRIVRTIGGVAFDAHAEKERRDAAEKHISWMERDDRLRAGVDGRALR